MSTQLSNEIRERLKSGRFNELHIVQDPQGRMKVILIDHRERKRLECDFTDVQDIIKVTVKKILSR